MKQLILVFFFIHGDHWRQRGCCCISSFAHAKFISIKGNIKGNKRQRNSFSNSRSCSVDPKAFKNALRTGGWLLSQAIKPFSKKTADWIRKNSKKVADWMDQGEKWTEKQFSKTLQKIGAPKDVADSLAKFMISLL